MSSLNKTSMVVEEEEHRSGDASAGGSARGQVGPLLRRHTRADGPAPACVKRRRAVSPDGESNIRLPNKKRDTSRTSDGESTCQEPSTSAAPSIVGEPCLEPSTSGAPSVAGGRSGEDLTSGTEVDNSDSDSTSFPLSAEEARSKPASLLNQKEGRIEKRGRLALNPGNVGKFTAERRRERKLATKKLKKKREAETILDPSVGLRYNNRLARTHKEEENKFEEYKTTSTAGITAEVLESVEQLRKAVQISSNLKGTVVRELWSASAQIAAGLRALGQRAQRKGTTMTDREGEDLRQENASLKGDLSRLRAELATQRAELAAVRTQMEELRRTPPTPPPSSPLRERKTKFRRPIALSSDEEEMPELLTRESIRDPESASTQPDPASLMTPGEIMPPVIRPLLGGKRTIIEPETPFVPVEEGTPSQFQQQLEEAIPDIIAKLKKAMELGGDVGGSTGGSTGRGGGDGPVVAGRGVLGSGDLGRGVGQLDRGKKEEEGNRKRQGDGTPITPVEGRSRVDTEGMGSSQKRKKKKKKKKRKSGRGDGGARTVGTAPPAPSYAQAARGIASGAARRDASRPGPVAGIAAPSTLRKLDKPVPAQETGGGSARAGSARRRSSQPIPTAPLPESTWIEVGRRRGGRGAGQTVPLQPVRPGPKGNTRAPAGTSGRQVAVRGSQGGSSAVRRPRVPTTAAVVLTCPEGTYASVMREARAKISPKDLGMGAPFKVRKTLTGALMLEVAGPDRADKANILANKLREVLASKEGVRVDRPVKKADFRLRDVEDSVTVEEIILAVADATGCVPSEVEVAGITRTPRGLATARVTCPAAVTRKIAGMGKITLGWFAARVELLADRPLTCYRCLEEGHVRQQCRSAIDRSGVCFRCGGPGHRAKECTGQLCCPVCSSGGKPVVHRMGGEACLSHQRKMRRGGRGSAGKARTPPVPPPPVEKPKKVAGTRGDAPAGPPTAARKRITGEGASSLPAVVVPPEEPPKEQRGPRIVSDVRMKTAPLQLLRPKVSEQLEEVIMQEVGDAPPNSSVRGQTVPEPAVGQVLGEMVAGSSNGD